VSRRSTHAHERMQPAGAPSEHSPYDIHAEHAEGSQPPLGVAQLHGGLNRARRAVVALAVVHAAHGVRIREVAVRNIVRAPRRDGRPRRRRLLQLLQLRLLRLQRPGRLAAREPGGQRVTQVDECLRFWRIHAAAPPAHEADRLLVQRVCQRLTTVCAGARNSPPSTGIAPEPASPQPSAPAMQQPPCQTATRHHGASAYNSSAREAYHTRWRDDGGARARRAEMHQRRSAASEAEGERSRWRKLASKFYRGCGKTLTGFRLMTEHDAVCRLRLSRARTTAASRRSAPSATPACALQPPCILAR
jgi:hypothetical protein